MDLQLKARLFIHKFFNWEYWSVWIIYLPCFIVYPFYALRLRSILFFTVANPGIENSGAFLSSKHEIYKKLPEELIPKTLLVKEETSIEECLDFIQEFNLTFPLIAKPDFGLRGLGIQLLETEETLKQFLNENKEPYLVQEFIDFKNEIGVFLVRQDDSEFRITSIVSREFMALQGDGVSNVRELILANPRYAMQLDWLNLQSQIDESQILSDGEVFEIVKIGNHSKGTIFRDANHINNEKLLSIMQRSVSSFEGFNYGRLDIKYKDYQDLLAGDNFKIIELNGVFSEPAHIYDPEFRLLEAWKVLLQHFKRLYQISNKSLQQGESPMSLTDGFSKINQHFKMVAKL